MVNVYGPEDPDDWEETIQKSLTRFMAEIESWPKMRADTIILSPEIYNLLVGNFNDRLRPLYASSPFTASRRKRRRANKARLALTWSARSSKFSE